ncbi:hypothetical protein Lser_V15G40399 [Lactuca serriola]
MRSHSPSGNRLFLSIQPDSIGIRSHSPSGNSVIGKEVLSSSTSYSPHTSRFHHRPRGRIRTFATAVTVNDKESDTFFADDTVSWSFLGVVDRLSQALSKISLNRPSLVQAVSLPPILHGNEVVVAAETGSGKTHGYLVPVTPPNQNGGNVRGRRTSYSVS